MYTRVYIKRDKWLHCCLWSIRLLTTQHSPKRTVFSRPHIERVGVVGVLGSQVIFCSEYRIGYREYRYDIDSMEYPSDTKMTTTTDCFCFCGVFYIWVLIMLRSFSYILHITFTYINIIPRTYTLHSIFVEVPVDSSWKKNTAVTFLCVWAFE